MPFGELLHLLVQGHQDPLLFCGVFTAKEFDGVEKGSGDTTSVDVQTLLEVFLNMFLGSACFTD
jgi:hypothetical protein